MFDISEEKCKIIRDPIHGYISIPKVFMEEIVDTEHFQRLRYIEQTGMRVIFPSGVHDRFTHSLGVYHLGTKAVNKLCEESEKVIGTNSSSRSSRLSKYKVLFQIACLLHDIGHTPFSHTLEHLYDNVKYDGKEIKRWLADHLGLGPDMDVDSMNNHEVVSSIIAVKKYNKNIKKILEKLVGEEYPVTNDMKRYLTAKETKASVIESFVDDDLKFIVRMISGIEYTEHEEKYQIRNCFISLLNGNIFDVDKLDYILRDSKMSGIDNVNIDVNRLLRSITVVKAKEYREYEFKKEKFSDVFIVSAESSNENFKIDTLVKNTIEDTKLDGWLEGENLKDMYIAEASKNKYESTNENIKGHFKTGRLKIEGKLKIRSSFFTGELNGIVKSMTVLNHKDRTAPLKNSYTSYKIGYEKGALSVIRNVILARNHLYLWIYAHHKVVYASNYLIPRLLGCVTTEKELICNILPEGLPEYFTYDGANASLQLPCDDDLISLIKREYKKRSPSDLDPVFRGLYEEYFNRKYKKSVYKSLADYDRIFDGKTEEDVEKIRINILGEKNFYEGPFTYSVRKEDKPRPAHAVVIDVSPLGKSCSLRDFFIKMSDSETLNLEKVPSSKHQYEIVGNSNHYFYIYLSEDRDANKVNIDDIKASLQDGIFKKNEEEKS